MKKPFCDLCEKPAEEFPLDVAIHYGKPWGDVANAEMRQPQLTLHVTAGFTNRKDGFGGPPDLCTACFLKLLGYLREKITEAHASAPPPSTERERLRKP